VLAGAIGLVATIAGLATASAVVALNTIGVICMPALVIGGVLFYSMRDDEPLARLKVTLVAVAIVSALAAIAFLAGRGLDEDERTFNFLTFLGIASILLVTYLLTAGWHQWLKSQQPAQKVCPDCANTVLGAATKCQFCGYRFNEGPTAAAAEPGTSSTAGKAVPQAPARAYQQASANTALAAVPETVRRCSACGAETGERTRRCRRCGTVFED
jgi:hypothetical protein